MQLDAIISKGSSLLDEDWNDPCLRRRNGEHVTKTQVDSLTVPLASTTYIGQMKNLRFVLENNVCDSPPTHDTLNSDTYCFSKGKTIDKITYYNL